MNLRKKPGHSMKVYGVIALLGWLIWVQSVEAAENVFPFIIEDGKVFEVESSTFSKKIMEGNMEEKEKEKGSAGKTSSVITMQNFNRYPETLTEAEKQILYKVVSMECDTSYEGSLAVISCMMNRTESDKYPNDLMEVVTEDSQFTAYYDKETGTYPYVNRKPSKECIAAVEDALYKGKRNLPSYILYFRSSEYTALNGYEKYGQIGDNTYFYLREDKYH